MTEKLREIWFKCSQCGRDSYCMAEFGDDPDSKVMCPFCRKEMKLNEVRIKEG